MLNIAGLIKESFVDGEGIRFTIFEQGCTHNCKGCQNPDTHKFIDKKLYTPNELLEMIMENPILDGVTFSGGDPFFQAKENIKLIELIREHTDLNIWAYTGYTWEEFYDFNEKGIQPLHKSNIDNQMIQMLHMCDVVVDGKFEESLKTLELEYVGSSNQRLIDVKKSIGKREPILYKCS